MKIEISKRDWTKISLAKAIKDSRMEDSGISISEIVDIIAEELTKGEFIYLKVVIKDKKTKK